LSVTLASRTASRSALALQDLRHGLHRSDLWLLLGWVDIRRRYRRSALGPFWLTLSMGVMIAGIALVNSGLFGVGVGELLPSSAIGVVLWTMISTCVIEGCTAFTASEVIILQSRQPFTVHVLRVLWRNLVIFLHNLVIPIGVLVFWPPKHLLDVPLSLLGLVIVIGNISAASLLLGVLCTRFRDLPQIVASVLQIAFFVTPIFWLPSQLGGHRRLVMELNPVYYLLEIVRTPMLGEIPSAWAWVISLAMLVIGWAVALIFFTRFRRRIPYWL
jgi:ABC-type polysaccharide/polyol phosphate export permease